MRRRRGKRVRRRLKRLLFFLAPAGVWFGFALALAGAFEQALQCGDPLWSSVYGFPVLHHYLTGFIILAVSLLLSEYKRRTEK
jgi:Ni/Fe-hydrogenase subunit HybB-like protein